MKLHLLLYAAGLLALTACSGNEEVHEDAPQPLTLSAVQMNMVSSNGDLTRAIDGYYTAATGFDGTELVRIYMGNETAVYNVGAANAEDSYHSPLTPAATRIYYPSGLVGSVKVWSVYPSASAPATALAEATGTHVVAYDQTGEAAYKASDLMYATKEVALNAKTTPQVLTFKHQLVKLKLIIAKGSDVSDIAKVELKNVKRQATVAATAEGMTLSNLATPSTDEDGDNILISGPISDTDTHTCVVVFPAQAWAAADFIKVTSTTNETAVFQLTKNDWTPGAEYVMTLTVDATVMGLTTTISGWTEGNENPEVPLPLDSAP